MLSRLSAVFTDPTKSPEKSLSAPEARSPAAIRSSPGLFLPSNYLLSRSCLMVNPFTSASHLQPLIKIKWIKSLSARKKKKSDEAEPSITQAAFP